ncbi:cytochrome P450 [Paraglaciecola sp. T6c]|uniref:cytochrome P450 n=1 Tax=Pseudoalteromonas atlantica (strain T6c / ATCC BAA-1087) TaxID=3042615 RepID=UPI00005C61D5|nr:cytochrome P450 [Paraglaciecola sp. T6c]ABG40822.1 cytochrome P450 [Paraglaciecola sp. T6c]
MKNYQSSDPFKEARVSSGCAHMNDQDDPVTMILRLKDVRKTAHNWKTFQSGAAPGRIVIPSEVNIRDTRQIPFEVDPPLHGAFRSLLDPWFKRPLKAQYQETLAQQVNALVDDVLKADSIDVVEDFALCLQSRALTLLLNTDADEADTWIGWGTHVFRSEDDPLDGDKAAILYDYIDEKIKASSPNPEGDLYSVLLAAEVEGKKLTHEEIKGIMILTFAGGRDTVINAVTNTVSYFAQHPESLARLRNEPEIIGRAIEELIRYFTPLTQMGRVVTQDTQVCEHAIKADSRVSLCWASANRDESVFESPNDVILDRKLNPHVSFGFSHHNCLGATHARQIMRVLIETLMAKVGSIDIIDFEENIEYLGEFERKVGFHKLHVNIHPR